MKIIFSSISRLFFSYSKFFASLVLLSGINSFAYAADQPTYLKCNEDLIKDIELEISDLKANRSQGIKQNYNLSSYSILSGKNRSLSNEIISLSHMREELITKSKNLNSLTFVQPFIKINKAEDDIIIWSILASFISFSLGSIFCYFREIE